MEEGYKPVRTYNGDIDIDTACVYGGYLTALIIEDGEVDGFYQVEKTTENEEVNTYRIIINKEGNIYSLFYFHSKIIQHLSPLG